MAILFQPPEIQLRIFKQITLFEILHFRLVSRQWKTMLERIGSFRRDLRIVYRYRGSSTPFNSIKLNDTRWYSQRLKLSNDGARFLSAVFPNIKDAVIIFDIKEFTTAECFNLAVLRDWSPRLVSLHLDMECFRNGSSLVSMKHEELWQIISSMDQLKKLKLNYLGRIQLPRSFSAVPDTLEELVIAGCDTIEFIEQLLGRVSPSLKKLIIPRLPRTCRSPRSVLAKIASSVTHLQINDMNVQIKELLDSLRYMTSLVYLDLASLYSFRNTSFPNLMATLVQLPRLYSISLSNYFLTEHLYIRHVNPDGSQQRAPPYCGPSSQTVQELILFDIYRRFLPCSVLAKAFPATIRVFITRYGDGNDAEKLIQGAPDESPVSCSTLVKRHFGEQTEVIFVKTRRNTN